jgi:N-acetyl-anhydromuramyl-L-alanine amidase AmpD
MTSVKQLWKEIFSCMYILDPKRFTKSLALKQNKLEERLFSPVAVILHQTGVGPAKRSKAHPRRWLTSLDAAKWLYTEAMTESPHFVVAGDTGEWFQVNPLNFTAFHVGPSGFKSNWAGLYTEKKYEWWRKAWPTTLSPNQFAQGCLWQNESCNQNTIGIEIVPEGVATPFSDQAWKTVKYLIEHCYSVYSMERFRSNILTHSEASPHGRTTDKGVPWDLYPQQFNEKIRDWLLEP